MGGYRNEHAFIKHKHFKPLPRRTFYRLTSTLLATHHRWSESRMVIFFLIKRTVWDRYLQVVIVKLDAINAASSFHSRTHTCYRSGAGVARGAHNSEDIGSKPISGIVKLDAINAASSFHSRTHTHVTGVAQRQRAWLITTRSYDRNVLPVLSSWTL